VTATAINNGVLTLGSFVFAVPGGWLGDRCGLGLGISHGRRCHFDRT
jgi:hypothetical protein